MKKDLIIPIVSYIIPFIIGIGKIGEIDLMLLEHLRPIYWSLISVYFSFY